MCISLQVGLWENRDQGVENILTSDSNAQFYTIIICLSPLTSLLPKILKLFGFPIFRHWAIWWKLFQKCIVRIKLDIYVFIATFKACIAYLKRNSPSLTYWHFCRLRKKYRTIDDAQYWKWINWTVSASYTWSFTRRYLKSIWY